MLRKSSLTMFESKIILVATLLCFQLMKQSSCNAVTESYHVYTSIQYRFATTEIRCVIRNADYIKKKLPFLVELPKDAFITKFTMTTGGITYVGEIKERTAGSEVYFEDGGLSNVIASRDGNKFGVKLPVAGGENATYVLVYQERLFRKEGVYEHKLYLQPGHMVADVYVETYIWENKDVTLINVPALRPLSRIHADYGKETNSLAIVNRLSPNKVQVIFAPTASQQPSSGLSHLYLVQYDVFHHPDGDLVIKDGFFMHFFAPDMTPMPKDIIFVIDVSGSMGWDNKMEQMQAAMIEIMNHIPPRDYFNIVPFSSTAFTWKSVLVAATKSYINEAKNYIWNLDAVGGTNIRAGIITARNLLFQRSFTERVAMIFFLTDGQDRSPVDDYPSIPIYGLAFGDDADLDYIKELCAKNGGFSQKIYTNIDAANQVTNFYDKISSVTMKKITFKYDHSIVDASSLTPTEFSLVVNGSEVVVMGKLKKDVITFNATLEIEAEAGKSVKVQKVDDVTKLAVSPDNSADYKKMQSLSGNMEKAWAFATIQNLLQEDQKKATVKGDTHALEQAMYLSVKFGFVSPLTSIVINDPNQRQIVEAAVKDEDAKIGDRTHAFITGRPPTTTVTTTTTTTTTRMPWCPPNTTLEDAIKGELLRSLTNVSRVFETCMDVNPGASSYLRRSMVASTRFEGAIKWNRNKNKNVTLVNIPRPVSINHISVHYKGNEKCTSPMPTFEGKTSYLLLSCPKGAALYVQTGPTYALKSASVQRLILVSHPHFATLFLGSSSSWLMYGDLEFRSEVKNKDELTLRVSCFNLTLHRQLSSLGLVYEMDLNLDSRITAFTGIMVDNLLNVEGDGEVNCVPLSNEDQVLNKYKQKSTKKFIVYFLDVLYDLIRNFPPRLWE
ncbi:inter-alpha-trypsin inhibitor heavy chain H2 [Biomphalaria glabrata]